MEWRFAECWTVRAEYLVADLETATHTYVGTSHSGTVVQVVGPPTIYDYRSASFSHDLQTQIGRIGLNLKF